MRRRTITLVVMGLVMALFVLPAAADVMLSDEEPADVEYELDYEYDDINRLVFYRIFDPADGEAPDCEIPEDVTVVVDPDTREVSYENDGEPFELPDGCRVVDIEGPNGQVNHGTFVSNMVHDLKAEYDKDMYGPFGQWVKQFAHDKEIGKDDLKVFAEGDDVDGDDDDGDDAASTSTLDNKPDKSEKSNNGQARGKNK